MLIKILTCTFFVGEKGSHLTWLKGLIFRQVALLVTGILLLLCRWQVMGSSPPVFQVVDNPTSFEKSLIMRVSTEECIQNKFTG